MTQTPTTMKAIEILVLFLAPRFNALQIYELTQGYSQSNRRKSLGGATLLEYFLLELLADHCKTSYPIELPTLTFRTDTKEETNFINALHEALILCFETDCTSPIEAVFSSYSGENDKPYMLQIAEAFSHCKNGTGSKIAFGDLPETWTIAICMGEATIADNDGNYGDTPAVHRELLEVLESCQDDDEMILSALYISFRNWRNSLHNSYGIPAYFHPDFGIGNRITMDVLAFMKTRDPRIKTDSAFSARDDYDLIGIELTTGSYDVFAVGLYGKVNSINVNYLGTMEMVDFEEVTAPFPRRGDWLVVNLHSCTPEQAVQKIADYINSEISTASEE